MLDVNTHKFFLLQVLKEIYADTELAVSLGFKGGTALMLFHKLPRFSVDPDFNLTEDVDPQGIHDKIKKILSAHGDIHDETLKHFGLLLVLNYEKGNRNLKVEISNRVYPDEYELRDYLGISMKVMKHEHMFTHKLMAILDRSLLTHRDIFDCWFCMKNRTHLIKAILDMRLKCSFEEYMDKCISTVSKISKTRILDGMGELLEPEIKKWVKTDLIKEFVSLAGMYKAMPMIKK